MHLLCRALTWSSLSWQTTLIWTFDCSHIWALQHCCTMNSHWTLLYNEKHWSVSPVWYAHLTPSSDLEKVGFGTHTSELIIAFHLKATFHLQFHLICNEFASCQSVGTRSCGWPGWPQSIIEHGYGQGTYTIQIDSMTYACNWDWLSQIWPLSWSITSTVLVWIVAGRCQDSNINFCFKFAHVM